MTMGHEPKIVLLTGGSSGIGRATADMLAEKGGMIVYKASRSARGPVNEYMESGGMTIPLALDVNDEAAVRAAVDRIVREHGRIDVLVSNAGNGIGGAVEDTSDGEARYQFETTFFGSMNMVRACLPVMRTRGSGKIILVGSVASFIPLPFQAYYSAAKSALLSMARSLSIELKGTGVSCGCILPGDVKTGFTANRKMTAKAQERSSAYHDATLRSIAKMEMDEQSGMPPEAIAKVIMRQVRRKGRVRTSVIPGFGYKLIGLAWKILPERFILWVVGLLYT